MTEVFKKNKLAESVESAISPETPLSSILTEEDKQTWEDIEEIYQTSAEGLVSIGKNVDEVVSSVEIPTTEEDTRKLTVLIKGLNRDLVSFANEMVEIHKLHENKKGPIIEDDFIESIDVYEKYVDLNVRISSIMGPTLVNITACIHKEAGVIHE